MTPHDLLTLAQSVRVDLLRAHLSLLLDRSRPEPASTRAADGAPGDEVEGA